jgi:dihydrofolate synthase/folylpolyglutamate synthase
MDSHETPGLAWLNSLPDFETDRSLGFGDLDRVRDALFALGNPQRDYRTVLIAGTNGKGSVALMLARLLVRLGLRVGLYRSPHLCYLNERISVDLVPIPDQDLEDELCALSRLNKTALIPALSRFEVLTVCALSYFANEGVDVGVLEVGMGGARDATNVVDADVAVLTSVGHDHLRELGGTLESVFNEKLGITREWAPLVLGNVALEVPEIKVGRIVRFGKDFLISNRQPGVGGQLVTVATGLQRIEVFLNGYGEKSAECAAIALVACQELVGRAIPEAVINDALAAQSVPGVFAVLKRDPPLVADSAHNLEAAQALRDAFIEAFGPKVRLSLVLGLTHGRAPDEFLSGLKGLAVHKVIAVELGVAAGSILEAARSIFGTIECQAIDIEQVDDLLSSRKEAMLVTGSNVLAGRIICKHDAV